MTALEDAPVTPVRGYTRRIVGADGQEREVPVSGYTRQAPAGFVTAECPTTYRLLAAVRVEQPDADGWVTPPGWTQDPANPMRTRIPAPMCPHGHYVRWARGVTDKGVPNCPPCHR